MSDLDVTRVYTLDTLFIKFANLPSPVLIPWIEVAAGTYVPEESSPSQMVFLVKKRPPAGEEPGTVTEASAADTMDKSILSKEDLRAYLERTLRETSNPALPDYGPVTDFRVQPAGRDMTKEVFAFMAEHGAV